MPNDPPRPVREKEAEHLDPRVARSTRRLGRALIELIQEREFSDITVRSILDRAGVGRATFYAHYRNKEDVLHSEYERVFTVFGKLLDESTEKSTTSRAAPRLFPVAEFARHVAESRALVAGLRASGRDTELWLAGVSYAARIIEERLGGHAHLSAAQRQLVGRMLAGALVESLQWWLDHPNSATAEQLEVAFCRMAGTLLA